MVTTSLDAKAALEILGSDVRLIDTATYALVGDVDRYECERLAMVSLPKVGITVCRYSSC